jgi:hypothetical protein
MDQHFPKVHDLDVALGRAPELPLGQGRQGFLPICFHVQFSAMWNVQFCLTDADPLPLRLSPGAGITGNFRYAMAVALGEAAASIHGTIAAFTVIVSRFGVPRPAIHGERDDWEELDAELPVGRRAG